MNTVPSFKNSILILLLVGALLLTGCGNTAPSADDRSEMSPSLIVVFFPVGKADAILLQTENTSVLIDAGEKKTSKALISALRELGVSELDCLILTHFDKDHVGGAAHVLKNIPVRQVLQSSYMKESDEVDAYLTALEKAGLGAETVREELSFSLDGVQFTVEPPEEEEYADDPSNNASLIVTVAYGERRLLFLGDAENARLNEWMSVDRGHYDLIKMPHHGSWHKPLKTLLEMTQPAYAVITSSDAEPEDEKTVDLLETWHVETFLTRRSAVRFSCDGSTLTGSYF